MAKPSMPSSHYLADTGALSVAVRLFIFSELAALIITVARHGSWSPSAWADFNFFSALALVVALGSFIVLQLTSALLKRLTVAAATVLVVVLVLLITAFGVDGLIFTLHDFGLLAERWPEWRNGLVGRVLFIALVVSLVTLRYLFIKHKSSLHSRSQQEAQMQALQSRIRPHFLFNSLNSVAALAHSDPKRAEAVLHDLADLFRVLLADARKLVPISAEREISRQYLEIEKLRLGDRLQIKWNVGEIPRSAQIPALTLQPLLENAIYHGIEPRFAGGQIKIDMWMEGQTLNVLISNPLPDVRKNPHGKGNRMAQENIRQRLATHFGDKATMQAFEEGGQYHVKVRMPILLGA